MAKRRRTSRDMLPDPLSEMSTLYSTVDLVACELLLSLDVTSILTVNV